MLPRPFLPGIGLGVSFGETTVCRGFFVAVKQAILVGPHWGFQTKPPLTAYLIHKFIKQFAFPFVN